MESDMALRSSKLLELLDIERQAEIDEFDDMFKTLSKKELERRGLCICNMCVGEISSGLYGKVLITFEYISYKVSKNKSDEEKVHKISNGDIVAVTDSNTNPSSNAEINGVVYKVTDKNITVSFNDMIDTNELAEPLTLCLLPNSITYKRCKLAVKKLNDGVDDDSLGHVRNILCGNESPSEGLNEFPEEMEAKIVSKWYNKNLNEVQKDAVMHCLKSKEISVIHGPPGTGKTTTLVEFIKKACLELDAKILCCAPSNIAVDNIAEKLIEGDGALRVVRIGHPARLLDTIQNRSLDALVQRADNTEIVNDSK